MKNIGVSDSAWEYLSLIKIKNGFKSLEDVVDYIIKEKKEEKDKWDSERNLKDKKLQNL